MLFTEKRMNNNTNNLFHQPVDLSPRLAMLREALEEGARWEQEGDSNAQALDCYINAINKKKPFKNKRLGARAVK